MKKQIVLLALLLFVAANAFAKEVRIDNLWYDLVSGINEAKVISNQNVGNYSGNIVIGKAARV